MRIVTALDASARQDMSGPGVALCLSTLLRASSQAARSGLDALWQTAPEATGPASLRLSQALRAAAERTIVAGSHASRMTDVALNALATATLEAAAAGAPDFLRLPDDAVARNLAGYATDRGLPKLSRCFLSHNFDHLFRYLVSRDVSDFIGGRGLPGVSDASQLRDAVGLHCRQVAAATAGGAYDAALAASIEAPDPVALITGALAEMVSLTLQRLAAAGG